MCIIAFALAVVVSIIIVLIKNALELNKERWQEIKKEL
jgi:capsular polysaccharide biosynthesis protein